MAIISVLHNLKIEILLRNPFHMNLNTINDSDNWIDCIKKWNGPLEISNKKCNRILVYIDKSLSIRELYPWQWNCWIHSPLNLFTKSDFFTLVAINTKSKNGWTSKMICTHIMITLFNTVPYFKIVIIQTK